MPHSDATVSLLTPASPQTCLQRQQSHSLRELPGTDSLVLFCTRHDCHVPSGVQCSMLFWSFFHCKFLIPAFLLISKSKTQNKREMFLKHYWTFYAATCKERLPRSALPLLTDLPKSGPAHFTQLLPPEPGRQAGRQPGTFAICLLNFINTFYPH